MTRIFDRLGATGFDDSPWFRNASTFLRYAWPPDSENDGFGDGTELERTPSERHIHWMEHLGHRFGDWAALDYAEAWRRLAPGKPITPRLALLSLEWYSPRGGASKADPKAHLFRDTGLVSAHTERERNDRNRSVAFRSSPFGFFNHMHSCQNAFNLFYGGERLTYWMGDASNAYGNAGLIRYRRHIALLHPNIVVIYDDLEADHEAEWTWQLHAHRKLVFSRRKGLFTSRNSRCAGELTFASSAAYTTDVGGTFDPPAINWGGKTYHGKKVEDFSKRWHASVRTEPAGWARFLSIVSVGKKPQQTRRFFDRRRRESVSIERRYDTGRERPCS